MTYKYCICPYSYLLPQIFVFRKSLQQLVVPNGEASLNCSPGGVNGAVDVANLVLRLLPSKDGVVLRRLLMTAVSASELGLSFLKFTAVICCSPF